ncbi:MAG TPA: ribosome silencing factor [Caldimonas sp.]|jgi:ribosome-associated protein
MDIRKLQRVIVDGLEDVKAQNIVVFNTEHLSPLFERVIVASGTSNRQTRSLAASVRDAVKSAGAPSPRTEGEANGEWIIVDCGAAVVHVMQPAIREYYHLEELWGDKPVRIKLGAVAPRLAKAEPPTSQDHRAPTRRAKAVPVRRVLRTSGVRSAAKTAAKGAPAKGAAAKKAVAKKPAKSARPAGRRPAARAAGTRR